MLSDGWRHGKNVLATAWAIDVSTLAMASSVLMLDFNSILYLNRIMASESPEVKSSWSSQTMVVRSLLEDGLFDGMAEGIDVGKSDACSLGLFEGIDVVGVGLGALTGLKVGTGDDGVVLGRRDGTSVVGILLGIELGCVVKLSVGDAVGLEDERPDEETVVGALVDGSPSPSPVAFVAEVVLLDAFFLASWRFFLSSSLVFKRSSLRCFFLSICFSVKRTRRLGPTLGATPAM